MSFTPLGLSEPLLRAVEEEGYTTPTPIQAQAIPAVLEGRDVMAAAQTGTGKTAGFTLPLLQRLNDGPKVKPNSVRALILTPTRELAAQVANSVATYGKYIHLKSLVVFGGVKINPQMMKLRGGTDILIATPGRLLDLHQQKAVNFDQLEVLILDEADRMLDLGFKRDINKLLTIIPKQRQNLFFSATFSDEIQQLTHSMLNNPVKIEVAQRNATNSHIEQLAYEVDKKEKRNLLIHLLNKNPWSQVLVFVRTKNNTNKVTQILNNADIKADAIHGNKSQNARTRALDNFKNGRIRVLVATDVAARGIDIDQLPVVINFDLPDVAENYVHRIGRTGRAGEEGTAISLICADEIDELIDIETLTQKLLPRTVEDGFEPDHSVPPTTTVRSPKAKRAKKPKPYQGKPSGGAGNKPKTASRQGQRSRPSANKDGAKKSPRSDSWGNR